MGSFRSPDSAAVHRGFPETSGTAGLRLIGGIRGMLGKVLSFEKPHPPLPATACPLTSWQPKAQGSPPNASCVG